MHNIGRGVMAWTTYELHDSLELCDTLPDREDRASCNTGVFLENIVNGSTGVTGHTTQYIKYTDPHYPCNILQDKHIPTCYFHQTTHMQKIFNHNYGKVDLTCSEAPQQAQAHCYASLGHDISTDNRGGDTEATILFCSRITNHPYHITCTQALAQARFSQPNEASEVIALCGMLSHDPENQSTCYTTIITRAHNVITDHTRLHAFCAELPQPHQQTCQH